MAGSDTAGTTAGGRGKSPKRTKTTTSAPQMELNTKIPNIEPKLSGASTYPDWVSSLQTYLGLLKIPGTKNRAWHILTGKYIEPAEDDEDNWQMWDDVNGVVKLTIINNCEPEVRARVGSFPKAKNAYDELKKAFEGKSVTELGALMKSVTRMNFDNRKMTIQEHIADYGRAWNTFTAITARLDLTKDDGFGSAPQQMAKSEKAKVEFLLDSLPPFYSNTVENIKSKEESYDDTIRKLIQYVPLRQKSRKQEGTKEDPVVLKTEKKQLDPSKTCRYCIDVKGWRGVGHTEAECYTKKREAAKRTKKVEGEEEDNGNVLCIKVGKAETKDGYFQFDAATTHHTTNKLETLTDIQTGAWEVQGHDGAKFMCRTKGTLTISHNNTIHHFEECLYDPTYSDLISGQRVNCQFSPINIEVDGFRGSISSKGTKVLGSEDPLTLSCFINEDLPATCVIDSGASSQFIDLDFALNLNLPLVPNGKPEDLVLADGVRGRWTRQCGYEGNEEQISRKPKKTL